MPRFVADEMVPKELCATLLDLGHEVVRSVEKLGHRAPDSAVAMLAEEERAIVVTWNIKHFEPLVRKKAGHAGALYFSGVDHVDAASRLRASVDVLDHEIGRGGRVFVLIGRKYVQVWR